MDLYCYYECDLLVEWELHVNEIYFFKRNKHI
jgi:hypothetical protein